MNVTFQYNNELLKFDENGDPPGRYEILNFQKLSNGNYEYVHVGDWSENLTWIRNASLQYGPRVMVNSVCSHKCPPGHYKVRLFT